ncbi:MAG: dipicolinate synthase subunit DpsA [Caulobacteraceae bacterium]
MQNTASGNEIAKQPRFLILGGDERLSELAVLYRHNGNDICTYGMDQKCIEGILNYGSFEEALDKSDIIICPVPFSKDVTKINTKYSGKDIYIEELFAKLRHDQVLLVGAINNYSRELARKLGVNYIDYYNEESYQILNTIPTAEGALAIIINETAKTLFESKVLVLGYGRIGKLLSKYLNSLGAHTFVEARKESDLTWIYAKRMEAVPLWELERYIGEMDIIVNTVPALILDSNMLEKVRTDVFILDLASTPGGVDFKYAEEKKLKVMHALGIPGKVACKSAAMYIYETIQKILKNM